MIVARTLMSHSAIATPNFEKRRPETAKRPHRTNMTAVISGIATIRSAISVDMRRPPKRLYMPIAIGLSNQWKLTHTKATVTRRLPNQILKLRSIFPSCRSQISVGKRGFVNLVAGLGLKRSNEKNQGIVAGIGSFEDGFTAQWRALHGRVNHPTDVMGLSLRPRPR